MTYRFITRESSNYNLSSVINALGINRSSYYKWFESYKNKEIKNNYIIHVLDRIMDIYYTSFGIYGSPKITYLLRKEGFKISQKTVLKYMHILGIQSIVKTNFPKKTTTLTEQEKKLINNLIKNIDITRPNQVWVSDITYIKTKKDGWVYLASILDLYSRKIIAWEVRDNMKKELVIDVLKKAYKKRRPPKLLIVHSDKGTQYRSHDYRNLLIKHHSIFSYTSLNHSCDENSNQESFHSLIKKEWIYNKSLYTIDDVKRECFQYIEGFYNTRRIHSSIGYLTPNQFEKNHFSSKTPSESCPLS